MHVLVRFGPRYQGGSLIKRCGRTDVPRFIGPAGPAGPDEVSVFWSDHWTGVRRSANVPVEHLLPFGPNAKLTSCVVLTGPRCGEVVVVHRFKKREKLAVISTNLDDTDDQKWEEPAANLCCVESASLP